ncbi:MAG: c-type cytochrome [Flavobacteriales bacterium]|nr:c-type cytochrome [Flavobacteriales bacterium]MCB9204031.1 c-type cytochrome [Flavobacteriales bacterium]
MKKYITYLFLIGLLASCQQDPTVPIDHQNIPSWFPEMEIPADNQLTQARIDLGRKLFYEKKLSRDESISCGSCHQQARAFTEDKPIALGIENRMGLRNTPTLANIGYTDIMFMDGGVSTLELQAQSPIFTHEEMDFTIAEFLVRIDGDVEYEQMFREAYDREPDAFGISRSIAAFERTFISARSRFDQYEYQNDENALSEAEKRGRDIFFSTETACTECHVPPLFTNFEFENIGLYQEYADTGLARITQLDQDKGKFKVPNLRNIAETAPYMHNGSMNTLEEVVEHFNSGGVGHVNQSPLIKPLGLTEQEKADLVAFLHSLTDQSFLDNPDLAEPN